MAKNDSVLLGMQVWDNQTDQPGQRYGQIIEVRGDFVVMEWEDGSVSISPLNEIDLHYMVYINNESRRNGVCEFESKHKHDNYPWKIAEQGSTK